MDNQLALLTRMRLHYRAFVCGKQSAEGTSFPGRK